jgi:TetR/AcrR family transcriptional regulator, transcriptional repressor for nem operon
VSSDRSCSQSHLIHEALAFDAEIAQRVTAALRQTETLMVDLIRQGQADGSISAVIDSKVAARLMLCLLRGMRVIGKTGRSRQEMMAVVDVAMKLLYEKCCE